MIKYEFIDIIFNLLNLYSRCDMEFINYAECTYADVKDQKPIKYMEFKSQCQTILPLSDDKPFDLSKDKFTALRKKIIKKKDNGLSISLSNLNDFKDKEKRKLSKSLENKAKNDTLGFLNTTDSKKYNEISTHRVLRFLKTKNTSTSSVNFRRYKKASETSNLGQNTTHIALNSYKMLEKKDDNIFKTCANHDLSTTEDESKDFKNDSQNSIEVKIIIDYNMCVFRINSCIQFLDFDKHFMMNRFIFIEFAEKKSHSTRVYNYHKILFLFQGICDPIDNLIDFLLRMNCHTNEFSIKTALRSYPLCSVKLQYSKLDQKNPLGQIKSLGDNSMPINYNVNFLYNKINLFYAVLCKKLRFDIEKQNSNKLISEFLVENILVKRPNDEYFSLRSELCKLQLFIPEFYLNIVWILKKLNDPLQNQQYFNQFALNEFENIYKLVFVFYELQLHAMHKNENTEKLKKIIFEYRQFIFKKFTNLKPDTMSATLYSHAFEHYRKIANPNFQTSKKANLMFLMAFAPETASFSEFYANEIYSSKLKDHYQSSYEFFYYKILRIKSHKQEMILILYTLILFISKSSGNNDQIILNTPILIPYRHVNMLIYFNQEKNQILMSFLKNAQLVNYLNGLLYSAIIN